MNRREESSLTHSLLTIGATALVVLALAMPGVAAATVTSCSAGDAPAGAVANCASVCTESGSELTCEGEVLCPDGGNTGINMIAVRFNANHDFVIWGNCAGTATDVCCAFDESAAIDTVTLDGTDDADDLLFAFEDGVDHFDMAKWDADDIDAFLRGNEGPDSLTGSYSTLAGYDESLLGGNGDNVCSGNNGADFLSGDNGDDILVGGPGNDTIWGGDGDDTMVGEGGHDSLCDASGYDECATSGGNFFDGGDGDDRIWYNESENPAVPCPSVLMHPDSTGGAGTSDTCGDNNDYPTNELCIFTETYITVEPTRCDGAH